VIREYIKRQEQEDNRLSNESVALIGHLQVAQLIGAASATPTSRFERLASTGAALATPNSRFERLLN